MAEYVWWVLDITSGLTCSWYNASRMKHVCHGCKYQGYFKSKLYDSPDNHLVSDTTVHNVTLLVLHFNGVVVLSSNNMWIPCHGHPIRTVLSLFLSFLCTILIDVVRIVHCLLLTPVSPVHRPMFGDLTQFIRRPLFLEFWLVSGGLSNIPER